MFGKTVPKTVDNFVALATGEVRHPEHFCVFVLQFMHHATATKNVCDDVVYVVSADKRQKTSKFTEKNGYVQNLFVFTQ